MKIINVGAISPARAFEAPERPAHAVDAIDASEQPGVIAKPLLGRRWPLQDLLASIHAIEIATRGLDRYDLAAVEVSLRDAADTIARQLRVERCLLDDWRDK
ncbi:MULTISPECIES: hypothetical protein [Bradyrhizobium]|jgi:hypothetical protein|uniref:hypothetical protein n=1 Tax=Bradyrhizobium TaxID=374 RepID=UPI0004AFA783|nr:MULTISPECIES: hypothetical protein [Bradyrhizobium]MBR1027350.1 hypothetical protein [Bradyrhizobium liaoningense]MDI2077610.1 hypothetical protein [Bradyrhizobium sp. Mp27]